jgi:Uma2 family endonuclease
VQYPLVVLHTRPVLELDEEQLFEFCRINRDWRIERGADGDLEIMPPTGGETSNSNLIAQPGAWVERDGTSVAFESCGGLYPS